MGKLIPMANIKGYYRYPILSMYGNWIETSIGGRKGVIHKSKVMMDKGVPVLMYHHILQDHALGNFKNVSTTSTISILKSLGYTTAFTTKPGYNLPYGNVFEIKRLESAQKTTLNNFTEMVAPYE